jgi:uncharacterized membrane protein YqhA
VRRLIERSVWLVMIGVVGLAATALVAFGWGLAKTYELVRTLLEEGSSSNAAVVILLETIDTYLTATVLVILAIGLYELFIGPLQFPDWLDIKSITDLKDKLIDVLVVVLAVKFVEKLIAVKRPLDVLWYGLAITSVSATLIAARALRRK